jgi:maltooligosyltrehalose trehalohydrolase
MRKDLLPQGAEIVAEGVRYRVWAPAAHGVGGTQPVEAIVWTGDEDPRTIPLALDASGYFLGLDHAGRAGDLYKYRLAGHEYPDPASRYQPEGVHGRSAVIDATQFTWHDTNWKSPSLRDLVIYELHIGTFTGEGTFLAAIDRLPHIKALGATAIEIMPVGDFAGERNWGYDGVSIYAPAHSYGHPDDLRALVDAAHQAGLAVILDVVYNHLGPDGNYLGNFAPGYIDEEKKTPWGGALRFDDPAFRPLRALFVANPLYWRAEFHIDGFRLDATHAIIDDSPRHILEEMTTAIREHGAFAIAEDARNDSRVILPVEEGGLGFDALWADDFHHTLRVASTGEQDGYLGDFSGTLPEIIETLRNGWFYRGQYSASKKGKRGTECRHIPPRKFVQCISNHDQVGNRALGERLNHTIGREAYLAASALLCLTPYTPLLFMGQEWAASTPFLFFTDHNEDLGKLVTKGRRKEFKDFAAFNTSEAQDRIPDPQALKTFTDSKLIWDELGDEKKSLTLDLYRRCLALRAKEPAFRPDTRESWYAEALQMGVGALRFKGAISDWLLLFDLTGGHTGALADEWICKPRPGGSWTLELSTNEKQFGGTGACAFDSATSQVRFNKPELLILRS